MKPLVSWRTLMTCLKIQRFMRFALSQSIVLAAVEMSVNWKSRRKRRSLASAFLSPT